MKLIERERGPLHVSADIGCHSFATLPPFDLGASIMGYGLGAAGAAALEGGSSGARAAVVAGRGARRCSARAALGAVHRLSRAAALHGDEADRA
jgi:hypothetical protein